MPLRVRLLHIVLAASFLAGCSNSSNSPTNAAAPEDAGDDALVDTAPSSWNENPTPPSDSEATSQRAACAYAAGTLPAATQGSGTPDGATIPIDTIFVLMMENRSFDHYFQDLPNAGQTDVDVAPANATNPGVDGQPVPFVHGTQLCFADTNHEWLGTHQEIDDGKMDGFAIASDGTHDMILPGTPPGFLDGSRAMVYYTAADLPLMYWAAANYAIADHYFASVPGPTWPNRMYLYAGSSFGLTTNTIPGNPGPTIVDYLETRGVSWGIYSVDTPTIGMFLPTYVKYRTTRLHPFSQLATDAKAGALPQVVFLDPSATDTYDENSEHPPGVMQVGENWIAAILSTVMASSVWPHAAFFLDYDEHGGLYDHVAPPPACPPDDLVAQDDAGPPGATFDMYGVRVPFVVFSPYAKRHYVSHDVYDHTSILRFIEARFRLPALTNRDANALAPWDMFDFTSPPNLTTPVVPDVPVDSATIQACGQIFANIPQSDYPPYPN